MNDMETVTETEPLPTPAASKTGKKSKKASKKVKAKAKSPKLKAKSKAKDARASRTQGKVKTAKAKGEKSPQAQSGPAIELKFSEMNKNEAKLIKGIFTATGARESKTIVELQKLVGGGKSTSPARNALRRLVRGGWIEKAERGTYRLTEKGRKRGIDN